MCCHRCNTPSIPLPSYVRNESAVKLGELLFTGNQLDGFRESPARAYNPEPEGIVKYKFDGDGRVVCLRIES